MQNIINRVDLQNLLSSNPATVLLEALPEKYYRDGHLPGARWFPHDRTKELASVTIATKDAPVVVYCASATCRNSHMAAKALTDLGYSDVRIYADGKADWIDAGLPIEK
jgi:rhodanese-related sulfurtransferase